MIMFDEEDTLSTLYSVAVLVGMVLFVGAVAFQSMPGIVAGAQLAGFGALSREIRQHGMRVAKAIGKKS